MTMASHGLVGVVLAILLELGAAIWVGGYVSVAIVTRVARQTLGPVEQVAFFRRLGRRFGTVTSVALLVALVAGAILLIGHPWDATLVLAVGFAVAVMLATMIGVIQARRMTRLRRSALAAKERNDTEVAGRLAARLPRAARSAKLLRGLIGVLTLILLVLGVILAG